MSLQPRGLPEIPEQTVAVARAAFPQGTLAMRVRDRLGEVFADEPFAGVFGRRGAPGLSPAVLSLVTALQFTENLRPASRRDGSPRDRLEVRERRGTD